uniref:Uncharacterized protein n=1 Tax=Arundo donax TaxID=35708 RepID=A0A0A9FKH3_ARUDO
MSDCSNELNSSGGSPCVLLVAEGTRVT